MEPREWECRQVVIKRRLQPRCRVVAHLASVGETNGGVRGIVGAVVVRHMASRASRVGQVVISVYVTLGARHIHVEARQREPRIVVIEGRRQPGNG